MYNPSFTYNGIRKSNVITEEGKERQVYNIKRNLLYVPGMPGAHLIGTDEEVKVIEQPISLPADSIPDLRKFEEEVTDWLIQDEPKELVFDDEPDRTYYAVVDGALDLVDLINLGKGTIKFLCLDPRKYGKEESQLIRKNQLVFENIFGRSGNFYDDGSGNAEGWKKGQTASYDFENKMAILTDSGYIYRDIAGLDVSKKYLLLLEYTNETTEGAAIKLNKWNYGDFTGYVAMMELTPTIEFKPAYFKIESLSEFRISIGVHSGNPIQTTKVRQVRLYEVSQDIYDSIDVDPEYTDDKLAEKFPFTEGKYFEPVEENQIITYSGTAPAVPEVEFEINEKTTFVGYTDGKKSVLVGHPMDVESFAYDREPIVFNNIMDNRSQWVDAQSMYGIQVGGNYSSSSYGLFPIAYGDGSRWHGPSVIRTLNEPLNDFRLSIYVGLITHLVTQMNKFECHLLSADNEIQARLIFGDFWQGSKQYSAEFYIGNPANQNKYTLHNWQWTEYDFRGVIQITKEGESIEFYVANSYENRPEHTQVRYQRVIDSDGLFSKPITKIQIATCQWANNPTAELPRYYQIALRKINPSRDDMIPYIADVGDKILIDKALNTYRNGQLITGLNPYSKAIKLEEGENRLVTLPPSADTSARWREAYK